MVEEACGSSPCTTILAGELFFGNQQHSTTSICVARKTSHLRKFKVHDHATSEREKPMKCATTQGWKQLEAARPVPRSNAATA